MSQINTFLGMAPIIWNGVVVNRDDPLKTGRCQVRIFGWHTENRELLPDSDLPWAMASSSPGATKSFDAPRQGDWVWGFFMDGESGQFPIYVGVLESKLSKTQISSIVNAGNANNVVDLTDAVWPTDGFVASETNGAPNLAPPQGQSVGTYTTAPLARSIVSQTAISKTNDELVHVCDISEEMKKNIALISFQISEFVQKIRTALKALWASTLASPIASQIRVAKKYIENELKIVQKFIAKAKDAADAVNYWANRLKSLLDYIATLPEKAAKLLSECLTTATAGIKQAVTDGKNLATSSITKEQQDALKNITIDFSSTRISPEMP